MRGREIDPTSGTEPGEDDELVADEPESVSEPPAVEDDRESDVDTNPRLRPSRSASVPPTDAARDAPEAGIAAPAPVSGEEYEDFAAASEPPAADGAAAVREEPAKPVAKPAPAAPKADPAIKPSVKMAGSVVVMRPARIISDVPPRAVEPAPPEPPARAVEIPAPPRVPTVHSPVPPPRTSAEPGAVPPRVPPTPLHSPAPPRVSAEPAPTPAPTPPPVPQGHPPAPPGASPLPPPRAAAARAPVDVVVDEDDVPTDPAAIAVEDVDFGATADENAARAPVRSRTPPPPPPAEPAKPKKPPPPPRASRVDDATTEWQKRPRQWWERFFSDDYLMSVLPPAPDQISRQVDFIEASLGLARGGTVLDVGCGLGLHALELARRGYLVVALDLSLPMITRAAEEAQHHNLKINFLHTDIREIQFEGAFDGVICMGTTFGFFDDDANRDVLGRLFHALKPGGRILVDVVNRDHVIKTQPNLVWFQGDGCVCMEESDFNHFTSRLIVKRTMMEEGGRQSEAEYSIRLYSLHELGQLMQSMGFRVLEVSGQEATRGVFFGPHSQRILMLAERRAQPRASAVMSRNSEAPGPKG